jgi:hypothetical protein
MACDMTFLRLNGEEGNYRPFVPRVSHNSKNFKFQSNGVENKIINLCRCACRKVEVITGGLNAA